MLAELWHERGETERAGNFLVECMRKITGEIRESKYNSDRQMFAGEYQHHRATYLRLFPEGASALAKLGLPVNPL
jgi:hypothetical protein